MKELTMMCELSVSYPPNLCPIMQSAHGDIARRLTSRHHWRCPCTAVSNALDADHSRLEEES